jgi:hypothetical protein
MKSFEPFTIRQPEGGESAARREVREPALLLLVGAVVEDRHRPERRMSGHGDRDGRVDARQLLDRNRVGHRVPAGAAVALRNRETHEAELAELGDEVIGEATGEIELLGDGLDTLLGERPNRVANQLLLWSQVEVHAARIVSAR